MQKADGATLVDTMLGMVLITFCIVSAISVALSISVREQKDHQSTQAHALLDAVAADLRYSLRGDLQNVARASSLFQLAPLPVAGRLTTGDTLDAYLTEDWQRLPTADGADYRLRMLVVQAPVAGSLEPVRLQLQLRRATAALESGALAQMPVSFPAP